MDVPKGFARKSKEIEEIVKKALEEYDALKKQKPADLSKLNYDAIEIEYKDGTREVIKKDLLRGHDNDTKDFYELEINSPTLVLLFKDKDTLYVIDECDKEKIVQLINPEHIKSMKTNWLRTKKG